MNNRISKLRDALLAILYLPVSGVLIICLMLKWEITGQRDGKLSSWSNDVIFYPFKAHKP